MTASIGAAPLGAAPAAPATAIDQLSPREHDTLRGIARGASNKESARNLGIAKTVKVRVQHAPRKLDVSSRRSPLPQRSTGLS